MMKIKNKKSKVISKSFILKNNRPRKSILIKNSKYANKNKSKREISRIEKKVETNNNSLDNSEPTYLLSNKYENTKEDENIQIIQLEEYKVKDHFEEKILKKQKSKSITPTQFLKTYNNWINRKKEKEKKLQSKILKQSALKFSENTFKPKTNKQFNKSIIKQKIYKNYNYFIERKNSKINLIKKTLNENKENEYKENCTFNPNINTKNKCKRKIKDLFDWNNDKNNKLNEIKKQSNQLNKEIYTFKPKILNLNKIK